MARERKVNIDIHWLDKILYCLLIRHGLGMMGYCAIFLNSVLLIAASCAVEALQSVKFNKFCKCSMGLRSSEFSGCLVTKYKLDDFGSICLWWADNYLNIYK